MKHSPQWGDTGLEPGLEVSFSLTIEIQDRSQEKSAYYLDYFSRLSRLSVKEARNPRRVGLNRQGQPEDILKVKGTSKMSVLHIASMLWVLLIRDSLFLGKESLI